MKAETQANALATLVQKKKQYPEYELTLPLFKIKQSFVKKMQKDDVLLVGLNHLDLRLLLENKSCANVEILREDNSQKIKIRLKKTKYQLADWEF